MADEEQQQEEQQQEQQVTGLTNPDGSLAENWMNHESLPEGVRGHESLNTVTDLPNAFKQLVHANKNLGKDKVVVPGPNATDEEKDAFYNATGRPKTAEAYTFEPPAELKEHINADYLAKAKTRAHQLGASQEQFDAYMKAELADALQARTDATEAEANADIDFTREMKQRFGMAYDDRMHVYNRALEELTENDVARIMSLKKQFGKSPDFVEFVSDCGVKLVEAQALIADITQQTPKENEARMNELRNTPGYIKPDAEGKYLSNTDAQRYKEITAEIKKLTQETYPGAKPAAVW